VDEGEGEGDAVGEAVGSRGVWVDVGEAVVVGEGVAVGVRAQDTASNDTPTSQTSRVLREKFLLNLNSLFVFREDVF